MPIFWTTLYISGHALKKTLEVFGQTLLCFIVDQLVRLEARRHDPTLNPVDFASDTQALQTHRDTLMQDNMKRRNVSLPPCSSYFAGLQKVGILR